MKKVLMELVLICLLLFGINNQSFATDNVIWACVHPSNGNVRIVNNAGDCKGPEIPFSWNIVGPQGPQGESGPPGADGADGQGGITSLIFQSYEQPGDNCPHGGIKIQMGLDLNANGNLDEEEQTATEYICNGEPGQQGQQGPPGEIDTEILEDMQNQIYVLQDQVTRLSFLGRFFDLGNGTVRDNFTGKIWLKDANCFEKVDFPTALFEVASLQEGVCGLTDDSVQGDWGIPTINEWQTFVDTAFINPALSDAVGLKKWSEDDAFNGVQHNTTERYWSSTATSSQSIFVMTMYSGNVDTMQSNSFHHVWPVKFNP
jgi:hypothetical protein